jgi:FkbM family methyltransferase
MEDDAASALPDKHRPAVSVVIPTFNRIDLLPLTVSSVLDQTFTDFELLVVDDGSTDGTAGWLGEIADPRLRTITLPHSGNVARVRNAGAAAATGRFLAFLDSDDLWLPRKLEVQMAATATDGRAWSYTRYEHIDAGGWRIPARAGAWRALSGRIADSIISTDASVSIVTVLVERALFEELGGFNERPRIREDYEFLARLAAGTDARAISECLVLVRDHSLRGTCALSGAEPFLVTARTYETLLESLGQEELRRLARRRRADHLVEACTAHLSAGSIHDATGCLVQAVRSGASPVRCAAAVGKGLGLERKLVRRMVRPLLGREARVWRWLPSPRVRRLCFADPIDCVIHALLVSKRRVRFIQIGSNDGRTNDPLWTFRRYTSWSGLLVEPLESAFARLSRNYAPWKDRFTLVRAAIAPESGPRLFHHFLETKELRADHDQLGSLDPEHVRRHSRRLGPESPTVVASEVQGLTFRNLLDMHGVDTPDLLHIDAEGADDAILRQVALEHDPPAVLLYEHVNLGMERSAALRARLDAAGYDTLEVGADTLAVSGKALMTLPALRAAWRLVGGDTPARQREN